MQITPQSWGRVYWSGGAGKRSEMDTSSMGGWRFHCNFCNEGNLRTAFARKPVADKELGKHCIEKHSHKTEVKALINSIIDAVDQMDEATLDAHLGMQSTTGAALEEAPVEEEQEDA